MRQRFHRLAGLAMAAAVIASLFPIVLPVAAQEALKPEEVTVEAIPAGTQKLLVADLAIGHIADGRLHVLNANNMKYLGLIGTGFTGQVYIPPNGNEIFVSTTYLEKLTRGKRSDFLEIYDSSTLALKKEIPISSNRASALNYRPLMQGSSDGRWMFIQNATPATSISIVDMQSGKQTGEVQNAGCYGIFPSAGDPKKFATICGDGTFGTYVLSGDGSTAERKASQKLFDADADALFLQAERDGADWLFVSYKGDLYRINIEGETATVVEKTTFATDGWRPSGYQTHALHAASGTLFVLMHPNGKEGSHKNPAEEIWAYDVRNKKLLSRSPTKTAFAVTVSSAEPPVVYAVNGVEMKVHRYLSDTANGYALIAAGEGKGGELPIQIELQQ